MPFKIETKSSGEDRYCRRDFSTKTQKDKFGNSTIKDYAGNTHSVSVVDGEQELDFEYQKKYQKNSFIDDDGNNKVEISVLDDDFIENLAEKTKHILDNGMFRASKQLPNGEKSINTEETLLSEQGSKNLRDWVNKYEKFKEPKEEESVAEVVGELLAETPISTYNLKTCQSCNKNIRAESAFCKFCGYKQKETCSECSATLEEGSNFCQNCGFKVV